MENKDRIKCGKCNSEYSVRRKVVCGDIHTDFSCPLCGHGSSAAVKEGVQESKKMLLDGKDWKNWDL